MVFPYSILNYRKSIQPVVVQRVQILRIQHSKICSVLFCVFSFPQEVKGRNQNLPGMVLVLETGERWKVFGRENWKTTDALFVMFTQSAVADYCSFIMKESHMHMFLDKNKWNACIEKEHILAQNTEVIHIIGGCIDVSQILCRQGLAFHGHSSDDNGNYKNLVYLMARQPWLTKRAWKFHPKTIPLHLAKSRNPKRIYWANWQQSSTAII